MEAGSVTNRPQRIALWEWLALAAALFLGGGARFLFAANAPGLWYDEAINGLDALSILREPGFPLFFDTNNHVREPLYMYFEAIGVLAGGTSAFAIRSVSAVLGTLTIPIVWLAAREWRGPYFALWALAFFAVLRWHVHFSGLAFRTILAPLFAAALLLFYLRFARTRHWRDGVLAGLTLGGGAYSYLAFRLVPFIMLIPAAQWFWRERAALASWFRLQAIVLAAAFVIFLPLGLHFLGTPDHFTGRSDEVTFLEREEGAMLLLRQARDVALMPVVRGDHVGKHNLPGFPQFLQPQWIDGEKAQEAWALDRQMSETDPHGTGLPALPLPASLLFYLGFAILLRDGWRGETGAGFTVAMLLIGSLASVLSFGAPNMLRLLILTPFVVFTVIRGGEYCWEKIRDQWHVKNTTVFGIGVAAFLLVAGQEAGRSIAWFKHPMVIVEFNAEWREAGDYLRNQPDRMPVRLPIPPPETLRFLADGYEFNPKPLPEHFWEFRTRPPLPPLDPKGNAVTGGRTFDVIHPAGILMGTLVETRLSHP